MSAEARPVPYAQRTVLDTKLNQGHAVAVGDFLGNGQRQIVAGWRAANEDGKFGIKIYFPESGNGLERRWNSFFVDENNMACEDLRVADLDADGAVGYRGLGSLNSQSNYLLESSFRIIRE